MYRPRYVIRRPRLHPSYRRYRALPSYVRSSIYRRVQQNPTSLLALAHRALHRPYTPGAIRPYRNVNRPRIRARIPR